jgi:hypothetical protein
MLATRVTCRRAAFVAFAALALASNGCMFPVSPSPSGGTLYQGTTDGVQYRSTLPRDAKSDKPPLEASGQACRYTASFPPDPPTPFYGSQWVVQQLPLRQPLVILAGDAGFVTAMEEASRSVNGAPLYDVRADMHTITLLSVLRRDCLEIHALAVRK